MLLRTYLLLPIFILFYSALGLFNSFFENGYKVLAEPDLQGPSGICLSASSGFAYAEFNGGGDPTDVFNWSITDANGFEVYYLADVGLNTITFAFSATGNYQVNLRVYRGANQNYYQESLAVIVQDGPVFSLPPDVVLCGEDVATIEAVSPTDPNIGSYSFSWTNQAGTELSNQNQFSITEEGRYFITITSAACTVSATTFAGPSIEVEVTPSSTIACLGETVTYTPDIPLSAAWSYQKAGQTQRTPLGDFFTLNLDTDNLEGTGEYTIFFNAEDEERPGCSVEESFPLIVQESAGFTLTKISDAEDCDATDGSFTITASTVLDEIRVNGVPDAVFTQLNPGDEMVITGLTPKLYVVTATLNGCNVTRVISVDNLNLDDPILFSSSVEDAICSPSGLDRGAITLDFEGGPQTGEYTFINTNGQETSGTFENQESLREELPNGTYYVQVVDQNNCTSPEVETITISSPNQVSFSVPATVTACEFYEFTPESTQDLTYTLTHPDGSTQTGDSTSTFRLVESGSYSVLATPNDPASILCPRTRTMNVTVNEQLEFDYSQRYIDCYGNQIFTAELGDNNASEVIIRWLTQDGVIVGRGVEFFPPSTGNFSLDVQPRASSSCPATPKPFEVIIPSLAVPVTLEAASFCGDDPFSTLTVESSFDEDRHVQWFFTDSLGTTVELLEHKDKREIDVTEEGTYEVVVRRIEEPTCEVGRDSYTLVKLDAIGINIEDEYQLCTAENFSPTINPGDFGSYSWILEGMEVNNTPTFKPSVPGNYELVVTDTTGCEASAEFEVTEKCETLVRYPNAVIPGNPLKDFKVYVDPLIENIEIYIYSRSGELVFHCSTTVQDPSQAFCVWDGLINGKNAAIGTYPCVIRVSSVPHEIFEEIKSSIFVVD